MRHSPSSRTAATTCVCTRSKIVIAAIGMVLALYLVAWSTVSSNTELDVDETKNTLVIIQEALPPAPEPSASMDNEPKKTKIPIHVVDTEEKQHHSSQEEGALRPYVDFFISDIERDELVRAGHCQKEVCYQQCDPDCFQYPRKTRECRNLPCVEGEDWLLYETELEYPLFVVDMPKFSSVEEKEFFLSATPVSTDYLKFHSKCPGPTAKLDEHRCDRVGNIDNNQSLVFSSERFIKGHVAIIKDGVYQGRPDDTFNENTKCAYSSDYHWIAPPNPHPAPKKHFDKLLILMMSVTGGAYFQHFIDRGLSILTQAWSMLERDRDIKVLVSPVFDRHPIVTQIYERIGLKDRLVYSYPEMFPITASQMYFSCVAPHYHPYTYQKARDLLGIDTNFPLQERRSLIYLSRRGYGRQVRNEDELLERIRKLLNQTASQGNEAYELEIYDHTIIDNLNDTIAYFNTKARALIGPHGGAFYNQIFCASKTLIVEFFPYSGLSSAGTNITYSAIRWPEAVWWPAAFMDHTYYHMPTTGGTTGNIAVDIDAVLRILKRELW